MRRRITQGSDLKVGAGDAVGDLFKKWLLHTDELRWLDHIQYLLNLPQEHHLNITRQELYTMYAIFHKPRPFI